MSGELARLFWLLVGQDTDNCVFWPKPGRRGRCRGPIFEGGAHVCLSRAACVLAKGPPPHEGAHAAHRCGHPSCINRRHIHWATARENQLDRAHHARLSHVDISLDFIRPEFIERVRGAIQAGAAPGAISAAFRMPVMIVHAIQAKASPLAADRPRVLPPAWVKLDPDLSRVIDCDQPSADTLAGFFRNMPRGEMAAMAADLGTTKSTLSGVASGKVFASAALGVMIQQYCEKRGFPVDLLSLVRVKKQGNT